MSLATNLIKVIEDTSHYPGTPMKKCLMRASDNSTYEADLLPTETELIIYLKTLRNKIPHKEITKLSQMIEDYGDERVDKAESENSMY